MFKIMSGRISSTEVSNAGYWNQLVSEITSSGVAVYGLLPGAVDCQANRFVVCKVKKPNLASGIEFGRFDLDSNTVSRKTSLDSFTSLNQSPDGVFHKSQCMSKKKENPLIVYKKNVEFFDYKFDFLSEPSTFNQVKRYITLAASLVNIYNNTFSLKNKILKKTMDALPRKYSFSLLSKKMASLVKVLLKVFSLCIEKFSVLNDRFLDTDKLKVGEIIHFIKNNVFPLTKKITEHIKNEELVRVDKKLCSCVKEFEATLGKKKFNPSLAINVSNGSAFKEKALPKDSNQEYKNSAENFNSVYANLIKPINFEESKKFVTRAQGLLNIFDCNTRLNAEILPKDMQLLSENLRYKSLLAKMAALVPWIIKIITDFNVRISFFKLNYSELGAERVQEELLEIKNFAKLLFQKFSIYDSDTDNELTRTYNLFCKTVDTFMMRHQGGRAISP